MTHYTTYTQAHQPQAVKVKALTGPSPSTLSKSFCLSSYTVSFSSFCFFLCSISLVHNLSLSLSHTHTHTHTHTHVHARIHTHTNSLALPMPPCQLQSQSNKCIWAFFQALGRLMYLLKASVANEEPHSLFFYLSLFPALCNHHSMEHWVLLTRNVTFSATI